MNYSFYELLCYFFAYGVLGWLCEVAFALVKRRRFVNRGFLHGPICPIYGFGVSLVLLLLTPLKAYPWAVYLLSVLITSALEWATGEAVMALFHERLWDYSGMPMHISGHVCLVFSLAWGVGCMWILYRFHPAAARLLALIPFETGVKILILLVLLLLGDTAIALTERLVRR